jgi:hypothetical protein
LIARRVAGNAWLSRYAARRDGKARRRNIRDRKKIGMESKNEWDAIDGRSIRESFRVGQRKLKS